MKDCSRYSLYKFYYLGLQYRARGFSWLIESSTDEFDKFMSDRKVTQQQLNALRDGMQGKEWKSHSDKPADVIMPFGIHQGKPITVLTMAELVKLSEQVWINRWPVVAAYLKTRQADIDQYNKDYEEGIKALKHLNI